MVRVARIERWYREDTGDIEVGEYDEVYYFAQFRNKKYWFDEELNQIKNPLANKGYDLKEFYKCVSNTHRGIDTYNDDLYGSFDADKNTTYDIIVEETDIMPYNIYKKINYKKEIWKRIKEMI